MEGDGKVTVPPAPPSSGSRSMGIKPRRQGATECVRRVCEQMRCAIIECSRWMSAIARNCCHQQHTKSKSDAKRSPKQSCPATLPKLKTKDAPKTVKKVSAAPANSPISSSAEGKDAKRREEGDLELGTRPSHLRIRPLQDGRRRCVVANPLVVSIPARPSSGTPLYGVSAQDVTDSKCAEDHTNGWIVL